MFVVAAWLVIRISYAQHFLRSFQCIVFRISGFLLLFLVCFSFKELYLVSFYFASYSSFFVKCFLYLSCCIPFYSVRPVRRFSSYSLCRLIFHPFLWFFFLWPPLFSYFLPVSHCAKLPDHIISCLFFSSPWLWLLYLRHSFYFSSCLPCFPYLAGSCLGPNLGYAKILKGDRGPREKISWTEKMKSGGYRYKNTGYILPLDYSTFCQS